jgi:peptide-methionine (S)-S-oxide reductase
LKATFAAGCFWGVESAFRPVAGVTATRVGYTGGHTTHPTYRQVCGHATGHAEAVEVMFDPTQVSYQDLLDLFWSIHNPTAGHRGSGSQYRSAILVHDEEQRRVAETSRDKVQSRFASPVTTEIAPAGPFWEAEEYHQHYYEKRLIASTCQTMTQPTEPITSFESLASASRIRSTSASVER